MISRTCCACALTVVAAACSTDPAPANPPQQEARSVEEIADLILFAERVHHMEPGRPPGQAVVIRGTRIVAVSSAQGALRYRGGRTRLRRFEGAHVFPGFQDAHGHVQGLGRTGVELRGAASFTEVVERVAARAAAVPAGSWIRGRGWDQNRWANKRMPDHRELSARVPDHPVLLSRVDGHAAIANAKAMELAGLTHDTKDPRGGRVLRFDDGTPTGVLIDRAIGLVSRAAPGIDRDAVRRDLLAGHDKCLRAGLTRVHDAGVSGGVRRLVRELEREGRWKLGIYGMVRAPSGLNALPEPDDPGPRARVRYRAVKLMADGALGSRGAALLADYSDEPGNRGLMTTPPERLADQIGWCRDRGYQPCIHAIGDRANRVVLDAFERVLSAEERALLRPRIEHAQVVAPEDLPRFAALGVIASMQPTHLTTDMPWAPARLGPRRIAGAYAIRALRDSGAVLCFGSDFPVEPVSPFDGIFAAVTTRPPLAPRADPQRPEQAIAREQAIAAFTAGAARAAFEEDVRGRIAEGLEADLTIVDRDLLAVPVGAILGTKVLATVVAGEIVYERTLPARSGR